MKNVYTIQIKGLSEPVKVSRDEYEFIKAMVRERRSDHWFTIAGYTVMIGDEVTLIDLSTTDKWTRGDSHP